jgi:lysozyme
MIRRVTARTAIAGMSVSALAFVALMGHEGWTDHAVVPVKGDVPTVGPGLTKRADGSPVQLGDTIKPLEGVQRSLSHIQKDEQGIKSCITVPLSQAEYDLMVDFSYQYGTAALCKSSIASEANAGRYQQSCEAYLKYRFVAGRDCSLAGSGCRGVWTRSQGRYQTCMAAQ